MAGGGTAQAMKISDVFIVVGISILVAGFIMHAWVSSEQYEIDSTENGSIEKSFVLFKNDKLELEVSPPSVHSVSVQISHGAEVTDLLPVMEPNSDLSALSNLIYQFTADSRGEYLLFIVFTPTGESDDSSNGEISVDVQRNLFIDFLPYPIGAISLAFGIHKRKEEKSIEAIDADLD